MSVLTFSDNATVNVYLSDYNTTEDVKFALDKLRFEGGKTNTAGDIIRTFIQLNLINLNVTVWLHTWV